MTPERIDLLNSVGFSWSGDSHTPPEQSVRPKPTKTRKGSNKRTAQEEWEYNFQKLLAFKKKYGHVRVNAFDDKTRNNQLRDWCAWQRREYKRWKNGQPSHVLTSEHIRRMKEVGFQWDQHALGSNAATATASGGGDDNDANDDKDKDNSSNGNGNDSGNQHGIVDNQNSQQQKEHNQMQNHPQHHQLQQLQQQQQMQRLPTSPVHVQIHRQQPLHVNNNLILSPVATRGGARSPLQSLTKLT